MANLEIKFQKDKKLELKLTQNGQLVDMLIMPIDPALGDKHKNSPGQLVPKSGVDIHFDNMLVTSIDKILKRNRIESLSLKIVKVGGLVDKSSVAYNIALA